MKMFRMTSICEKKLQALTDQVQKLHLQLAEASVFIRDLEKGSLHQAISDDFLRTDLGTSLQSLKERMTSIAEEERIRNWHNTGIAIFSDILRNKNGLSFSALSDSILINLVKYLGANQGALFTLENETTGEAYLNMVACYAYNRKKYLSKKFELGEGLAGQSVLEGDLIHLKKVPENYISITSGLGESRPRSIVICPLKVNESIYGVIEVATLTEFTNEHIDFITKIAESIGSTIKSAKENERTVSLLNASQQQTEELRAQEEEMRQNMEEMQATQEEMKRKSDELLRNSVEISEMTCILNGINATMATIEFTPEGIITGANENFINTMNYSLEAILGRHHSIFIPKELLNSIEYQQFWKKLSMGESIKGIFKRITSDGRVIWLRSIYNPITNSKGMVSKVLKLAVDITSEQEMHAESKGILSGINETMATVEFSPSGEVLRANDNFLKIMKYRLKEIEGLHHGVFVHEQFRLSEDYQTFWSRLKSGQSIKGTFERISSNGDIVWFNAIYNPITNANGDVIRIIKFATEVHMNEKNIPEANALLN